MLCLAVTYIIQEGHEGEALDYLRLLTENTRQEPGNIMYVAHRSTENPRQFFIYEQYQDQAALDAHRASLYFQQYGPNGLVPIAESRTPALYAPLD